MKNIYMVQPSNTYSGQNFKAAYLPYAAGLLVANAFTNETVKSNYEFKRFIFIREKTEKALASLENPAIVGFSNYVWNTKYNLTLAEKIKEKYPDCIIIFGGHNVAGGENSFLDKYDFIDFLIRGEGEEAFCNLLCELCKETPDYSSVSNLSYRSEGKAIHNPVETLTRIDYPSPYLTGLFDDIYKENPDMQLDAILETSRGCPNSCAYCDWGCNNQKIKRFPIERIYAEIDWLAAHKTKFIWGADANFGAFERDLDIVDYFVSVREKTGYPERLRINYAKANPLRVFEINKQLEQHNLTKQGATISFQSLNPETLENIGRKNMDLDSFSELLSLYRKEGITIYSELIVGLPGETYESFCSGIGKLLAAGQHRLITTYICVLLPNSPMADPDYMEKHGIISVEVPFLVAHTNDEDDVVETTSYIIGTNTMCPEDWIKSNIFTCFEESYHHFGILKFIAIYLFTKYNVPYEKFYNDIINSALEDKNSVAYSAYQKLYSYYKSITESKPISLYQNDIFGDLSWSNNLLTFLDTIYRLDTFYDEIRPLLQGYGVPENIIDELIRYQKTALKLPGRNNFGEDFSYNWHDYFKGIIEDCPIELSEKPNTVRVMNKSVPDNWKEWALESVWFNKNGITFNPVVKVEYK